MSQCEHVLQESGEKVLSNAHNLEHRNRGDSRYYRGNRMIF